MPATQLPSTETIQLLVLERRDATQNMARYYVLSVQPTLFGDIALVREWGRIGTNGRRRIELHTEPLAARIALSAWLIRKRKRGYVLSKTVDGATALV